MTECAPLAQIYGEVCESDELLPMGDVGVEFGYVLYQAAITVPAGEAALELENVRDYAAVYLDGVFQGTLTDNRKTLTLKAEPGRHTLQLYVENIGRITYGPEILDNSKGLFGEARPRRRNDRRLDDHPARSARRRSRNPRVRSPRPVQHCPVSGAGSSTVRRTKEPFTSTCRDGGMGRGVDQRALPRLVLGRGETAVDPHSGRNPRRKGEPHRGFRPQKQRPRAQRCASRTNPCSNNKHNL